MYKGVYMRQQGMLEVEIQNQSNKFEQMQREIEKLKIEVQTLKIEKDEFVDQLK